MVIRSYRKDACSLTGVQYGCLFVNKREQCQVPRALNRNGQRTLMLGACSGLPPGPDTAKVVRKTTQHFMIFIVDHIHFIDAERADATPRASRPSFSCSHDAFYPSLRTTK
jgi:hypothetical protein